MKQQRILRHDWEKGGLMTHWGTHPRVVSLLMWITGDSDIFFRDVLCALLLSTSTTVSELSKSLNDYIWGKLNRSFYVSLWIGRTTAMTGWLSDFTTWVKEIASECESMYCVMHKEMLASQICDLSLTMFCRMWLKLLTTQMYQPLTHVCSCSSVRRWRPSTQKWDGFLRVYHWQEFLNCESHSRGKAHTTGSTFQGHKMGQKTGVTYSTLQWSQSVTSGENDNCV